jgi:hypothetical protein
MMVVVEIESERASKESFVPHDDVIITVVQNWTAGLRSNPHRWHPFRPVRNPLTARRRRV